MTPSTPTPAEKPAKKLTVLAIKQQLRGIHITNPHNVCTAGGGRVYVAYQRQDTGRGGSPAKALVVGVTEKTDPSGPWYNQGCKAFLRFGSSKSEAIENAKRWATEKYGIQEWARDPFGGWQDAAVLNRVIAKIK